jgi:hypothetical protein
MRIPASPRASDMLRMIRKPWIRVRGMREWAPQARLRWTTPRYAPHLRGKFRPRCALGLLLQRLANTEARIIRMVHDEIILEVPDRLAGEVAVILKETMVQPYSALNPMRRSPADAASHSHRLLIHSMPVNRCVRPKRLSWDAHSNCSRQ